MKALKVLLIIFGIIMIVGGFYCCITAYVTFATIGWIVGICMLFDAFARFDIWWDAKQSGYSDGWILAGAIISLILGIVILAYPMVQAGIDVFAVYFTAGWLIVEGIMVICRAFQMRKFHKTWNTTMVGTHWVGSLIVGILLVVFGIFCCYNPQIIALSLGLIIGLGIITMGFSMIGIATSPVYAAAEKLEEKSAQAK